MLKLIIEDDDKQVKVVRLLRDEITIGRKEGNTIRLTERNVSRRHAKLFKKDSLFILEDLGSYNGVKLNGKKITEPVSINEGDKIAIGDYMLMLKVETQAEADPFEEMATVPVEKVDYEAFDIPVDSKEQPAVSSEPVDESVIPSDLQAKLVVITSNYAGTSFVLKRKVSIIGRTPENDVALDHKSISRNHAKIVFDGLNYSIEDMQSANGVRINGEQYDKMALRKGDTIDLGHVRFKFVAPGDDFVFTPETTPVVQSGNKNMIFIGIGIVVVVAVIAFVGIKMMTGGKKSGPSKSPEVSQNTSNEDLQKSISKYQSEKKWKAALSDVDVLLGKADLSEDLKLKYKKLKSTFTQEVENEKSLESSKSFVQIKTWDKAFSEAKKITSNSVYHPEAAGIISKSKTEYLVQIMTKSKEYLASKKCDEIKSLYSKAKAMEYSESELMDLSSYRSKCSGKPDDDDNKIMTGDMKPRPEDKPDKDPPDMAKPMDPTTIQDLPTMNEKPMATGESAESLLAAAKAAYSSGNCGTVVRKATKAYSLSPSQTAVKYVGLCGCNKKKKGWAKWAYQRASGNTKNLVFKLCKKNGIALP
ncbi:FHA domain-containing protein [Myxococcota bacterium]|nr:FHA domain-containing protein [Myxococcota bacterium]MBU1379379.1 FHA domain-containing protein [Myxococcota bacterium]MBU1496781.1 FHA domain-containing protein [Myxococcota bacterium]